ncbi:MAG: cytochrome c3 family protein [Deltaproteobacteria bacterium]
MSLGAVLWLAVGSLGALGILQRLAPAPAPRRALLLGLLLAGCWLWSWNARAPAGTAPVTPAAGVQTTPPPSGYTSSAACRSCHPSEYQSWHQSYHRSMTEVASAESVRAPWQRLLNDEQGRQYRLFRRDDEFWVELPDPDQLAASVRRGQLTASVPRVERRMLMTTGSHHYQGYWLPGLRGNELWQLPFVYHFESQRFLPRRAVFLEPPDDPPYWARWNSSCIQCHSVAGQPQHDAASDRFATRAAELGIACEACHGPGAAHVARQQNPLTRYQTRRAGAGDSSIVSPARLGAERASELCGQCHAYFVPSAAERWWQTGFVDSYRPGDDLSAARHVLDYEQDREHAVELVGSDLDSSFYADGSVRVGGREWNGLRRSACFEQGQGTRQISCLSCHQLHGGTQDAQLRPSALSNAACAGCHPGPATALREHTHHAPDSSGSSCVNCHMPYTSYALLGGVRSHRITRPSIDPARAGLAPNACNSCHLDRGLAWTRSWLDRWYRDAASPAAQTTPERAGPQPASLDAAAALALLQGDAATRVVVAAQLGRAEARAASRSGWQAQLLVEALTDPYAAVRFVAYRSLRSFPGFEDLRYDFIAEPRERQQAILEALERARRQAVPGSAGAATELPMDAAGVIPTDFLAELSHSRDPRPVRIAE